MKQTKNKYKSISDPLHPFAQKNGLILEHVAVWCKHYDYSLLGNRVIHHINGDKSDNRIDNLVALTSKDHTRLHKLLFR